MPQGTRSGPEGGGGVMGGTRNPSRVQVDLPTSEPDVPPAVCVLPAGVPVPGRNPVGRLPDPGGVLDSRDLVPPLQGSPLGSEGGPAEQSGSP